MTRQFIIAATVAITLTTSFSVQADCGSRGCRTHYGRYTAHQVYVLFKQRPELIQRFPQIARELQTQFGAIPSIAAAAPAIPTAAAPATPPVVAAQASVSADPAPAPTPTPAVAPPAVEAPQLTPAVESLATDETPEIEVDANGFPTDLPFEDPLGEL